MPSKFLFEAARRLNAARKTHARSPWTVPRSNKPRCAYGEMTLRRARARVEKQWL
jgi:hypothetical protein